MATTTSRPSHAPNVVLIVGTAPTTPRIRSQVRLLPEKTGVCLALQNLTMMLPSRLGCPLSLNTPNMGNPDSLEDLSPISSPGEPLCPKIPIASA